MAGIVYRFNLFQVQRWLRLPDSLTSAISRAIGNWFSSESPPVQPYAMGATLEIQRLQQIEHYEQQALRARMGNLRNRVMAKDLHWCGFDCKSNHKVENYGLIRTLQNDNTSVSSFS